MAERRSDPREILASLALRSLALVGVADLDGNLLFLNPGGAALIDAADAVVPSAGLERLSDLFAAEDQAFLREAILTDVMRRSRWTGDFRLARRDGSPVAVELDMYLVYGSEPTTPVGIAIVSRDIAERKRSEQRLRTLVDAGAVLTNSFEYPGTFVKLAELIARTIGTYCIIDLVPEGDPSPAEITRVATYHFERAKRRLLAEYARTIPSLDDPLHPIARTLRDGSSSLIEHIDATWIAQVAYDRPHRAALEALGPRSEITVPLVAAGTIVGALTCGLAAEDAERTTLPRSYDAEDIFFLEELGRRAGVAIVNAQLFERQRRIAEALQAASLPLELPSIPGMHVDAAYRPGNAEATIGGDWYDVFALLDGCVVFTVGDVMGNGLHAAVTMTKLRQAMQSAAMVRADPLVMLQVADRTLHLHDPNGYATALAAIFDPASGVTTIASAGHAGPLLRAADGTISEHSSHGLLLGVDPDLARACVTIATPPGSQLVFFTDGLTEATRSIAEGMERLKRAIADDAVSRSGQPATAIVEHVLGGAAAGDDIAVLTVAFV